MVKIKDLTDKQLLSQLEKYEKIYTQLTAERDKRVAGGANPAGLRTNAEKAVDKIQMKELKGSKEQNDQEPEAYHLSIDDSELSTYADEEGGNASAEETKEVRVTQLLKLSQDQLNELRSGGKNKNKKKG